MLVLSRKEEESIIIDDEIKIKVLAIDNNRVQLGIEASDSVSIHREEVYQEIQRENQQAVYDQDELPSNLSGMLKKKAKKGQDKEN